MKDLRSIWLIVALLIGSPTLAHALDISGTIGILFGLFASALLLILVPILVIVLIYKFVKKKV